MNEDDKMKRLVEEKEQEGGIFDKVGDKIKSEGLGKVDLGLNNEINIETSRGFIPLDLSLLPSRGRFYPKNMKINIRPASVSEIKEYSIIDETNLFDVDKRLNMILAECCKVEIGNRYATYKDILEEDRIYVILSIREITFNKGKFKLDMKSNCKQCEEENTIELRTENLQYNVIPSNIDKYYSDEERCFVVKTKSSGEIRLAPPRIGVMQIITETIRENEAKNKKWSKDFYQILPYIQLDWRNFDSKAIFDREVDYSSWTDMKYMTIFRLAEKIVVGVKESLTTVCKKCGAEVTVPLRFPGGIKSLFVPDIDFDDELL